MEKEKILIAKPGQSPIMVSPKAFNAVYKNKGFSIVDRAAAAKSKPAGTNGKNKEPRAKARTGSAADVAATLGLTDADDPNDNNANTGGRKSKSEQD